jgi:hypothetical protein
MCLNLIRKGVKMENLTKANDLICEGIGKGSLRLDKYQGENDKGIKFGFVYRTDAQGGYFFDWLDTLEATLDSLEPGRLTEDIPDSLEFSLKEARDFLEEQIADDF